VIGTVREKGKETGERRERGGRKGSEKRSSPKGRRKCSFRKGQRAKAKTQLHAERDLKSPPLAELQEEKKGDGLKVGKGRRGRRKRMISIRTLKMQVTIEKSGRLGKGVKSFFVFLASRHKRNERHA